MKWFIAVFALLISCISIKAQLLPDGVYQVTQLTNHPVEEVFLQNLPQQGDRYLLFDGSRHSITLLQQGHNVDVIKYNPKQIQKTDDGTILMLYGSDNEQKRCFLIYLNRETGVCEYWIQHPNGAFSAFELIR